MKKLLAIVIFIGCKIYSADEQHSFVSDKEPTVITTVRIKHNDVIQPKVTVNRDEENALVNVDIEIG